MRSISQPKHIWNWCGCELTDNDIKTANQTVFYMCTKLKKRLNILSKANGYNKKRCKATLERWKEWLNEKYMGLDEWQLRDSRRNQ